MEWWYALWKAQVIAAFAKRFQITTCSLLLINIISTYANLLQHFIFARFLLTERRYGKCTLRKGTVIGCSFKHIFFESLIDKFH